MSGRELIEAVWDHRIAARADALLESDPDHARRALAACQRIVDELRAEIEQLEPVLDEVGEIIGVESTEHAQNHTITWLVPTPIAGERAASTLAGHGFEIWERWDGGALESFRRSADQITVARTRDDATLVVRFRWRGRRKRGLGDRALTPTSGDWSMVNLPRWAWRGYSVVRLFRLTAERVGLRPRHRASLGPFLSTPDALLDPLFDLAEVGPDDTVVDIGAGDGRIAIEAARRRGCRALGVEADADLVDRARGRALRADVVDRVTFVHGDARSADLAGATVVFMFLPIDVAATILPEVRSRLPEGARIVLHEQTRLPAALEPDESRVVIGRNAVSVAHLWRVSDGR